MFFLVLSGVAAAGAFLTKGFLGLAFPAIIAGGWLIWQKRWRDLFVLPLVPIASAIVISAPLIIQIHKHNSGFWDYFFWVEHVRRFTSPDGNQHPEPWWYFLPMLPVGAMLWTLNIGKVWSGFRTSLFRGRGASLCAVWIALPLLLLSASSGKLPAYILPIFPAFSIVIAISLLHYFSKTALTTFADQLGRWLLVAVALLCASFILTGHQWLYADQLWRDNSTWRFGLLALALLAWAALDHWAQRTHVPAHRLMRMAFSPAPVLMIAGLLLPDALIEKSKIGVETLRAQSQDLALSHTLIVDANMATCVAYSTKRFDMTFIGPGGELDNELKLPLEQARFITREQVLEQVALAQKTGSVALVIMRNDLKAFQAPDAPKPQSQFIDGDVSVALFTQVK
jgi:4-amino-4-deoxy-L-arabinose transferase